MAPVPATLVVLLIAAAHVDAVMDGICKGANCVGIPTGCNVDKESSCDVLAKVTGTANGVQVQLFSAGHKSNNLVFKDRWISLGVSDTGDMPNAPVFSCFEDHGKAVGKLTFNSDQGPFNVGWTGIDQSQLTVTKAGIENEGLTCEATFNKRIKINDKVSFDLTGKPKSLILATGPMIRGAIAVHDVSPTTTGGTKFTF